jgi:hypothetical protein
MWRIVIGCVLLALGILVLLQGLITGFLGQNMFMIPVILVFCGLLIWGGWKLSCPKPKAAGWILFICGILGLLGDLIIWFSWGNDPFIKIQIISGKLAALLGCLWSVWEGWKLSHPKSQVQSS